MRGKEGGAGRVDNRQEPAMHLSFPQVHLREQAVEALS
jgi:hypothetical protein